MSQATTVFTIAAGPESGTERHRHAGVYHAEPDGDRGPLGGEPYGARAEGLLTEHKALESRAWSFAPNLLSPAQIVELRSGIEAWHRENPLGRVVPFIHLEDFAFASNATLPGTASSGSIFSFLGIDPLSNLDPAVREIAQTRQLAERAVYYGQRAPKLISMEAQRLTFAVAMTPESVGLLNSRAPRRCRAGSERPRC